MSEEKKVDLKGKMLDATDLAQVSGGRGFTSCSAHCTKCFWEGFMYNLGSAGPYPCPNCEQETVYLD